MSINATRLGLASKLSSRWPHTPAFLGPGICRPSYPAPAARYNRGDKTSQKDRYISLSIPSLFGRQARSTLTITTGLTCRTKHPLCALRTVHHTILLALSAWTPGAAGVGMASRYLSEH